MAEAHPGNTRIPASLSQFMDFARWLSALMVVFDHINNRMFTPTTGHSMANALWVFLVGFGHQAVVVFFVLSGFLVGGKVIRECADGSFVRRDYLIDRISRIYLVLLPALFIVVFFDSAGLHLFGAPVYDAAQLADHLNWRTFFGNAVNLQTFLVPTIGTDGPLGTLANEFWYYLTFPLFAAPLLPRLSLPSKLIAVAAGVVILAVQCTLQPQHGIGFVVWLSGAAAATLATNRRLAKPLAGVVFLLAILLAVRLGIRKAQYTFMLGAEVDLVTALAFSYVLYAIRVRPGLTVSERFARINTHLAGFSYSTYAIHAPVIVFVCAVLKSQIGFGWHEHVEKPWQWAVVAGVLCLAVFAGYALSLVTERNTAKARAVLRSVWPANKAVAPS